MSLSSKDWMAWFKCTEKEYRLRLTEELPDNADSGAIQMMVSSAFKRDADQIEEMYDNEYTPSETASALMTLRSWDKATNNG